MTTMTTMTRGWGALLAGCLAAMPMTGMAQETQVAGRQVTVALGRAKAIKYDYLGRSTPIGFRGTVLLPQAQGRARVQSHEGGATIRAVFEGLQPAARFGPENLTYVLWAISPAGQATNLGELLVKGSGSGRLTATTHLQTFGLIVTAEPHFAVSEVSELVVLENVLSEASPAKLEWLETSYPLLPKGTYVLAGDPAELTAPKPNRRVSPYVQQARNALRIARAAEAERLAPADFQRVEAVMARLEREKRLWQRPAVALARQVVQLAEDARALAVKEQQELRLAEERQRAEVARQEADRAVAAAETARLQALQEAQQARQEALQAKQQAVAQTRNAVKQEVRKKLSRQLGVLLETQDTEKGLIVRMSNVLFPTGRAVLLPPAREKFAKVAGILLAYPGLSLQVEGHTDSTGKPEFNEKLSEQRAATVRNFLIHQGIPPQAITARGLRDSHPLTSNDTPTGRQQNRRVELIVTGDPIGI